LRTLEYVENQTRELRKKLNEEEKEADKTMEDRLNEARTELQAEIDEVQKRDDLDPRSKSALLKQKEEQLNRKLDLDEQELEREKNSRIRKAGLEMKREIRRIETAVKIKAYVLPAILPICFGLLFLGLRRNAEQQSIAPSRRRK
ncbi:MAG: hypothetical protein WBH50_17720, partial [Fuerstiella sp.]